MTFEPTVSLGALLSMSVTLLIFVIGAFAGYVTLRNKVAELENKNVATNKAVDAFGIAIGDVRKQVSEECVKKIDLDKVEDRLARSITGLADNVTKSSDRLFEALTKRVSRGGGS